MVHKKSSKLSGPATLDCTTVLLLNVVSRSGLPSGNSRDWYIIGLPTGETPARLIYLRRPNRNCVSIDKTDIPIGFFQVLLMPYASGLPKFLASAFLAAMYVAVTYALAVAADPPAGKGKAKGGKNELATSAKGDTTVQAWLSDVSLASQALSATIQQIPDAEIPARMLKGPLRTELLRYEILRRVSPAEYARFLKSPAEQQFLMEFFSQAEWMESFVGSGPLEGALTGLLSLAAIYLDDQGIASPGLKQRIATCVSLETAKAARTPDNAVKVYRYYRDRNIAGLLHPGFAKLAVWEMRFAVGARFSAADLAWIGNRANFSAPDAVNAAWQVQYLDVNPFGQTVQSDWYYQPWYGNLDYAQCMVRVGGVCGSLSHAGAMTAQAYGIPAVTMGEPGHCAYAVRPSAGHWLDGNSVDGNDRSPHRCYFFSNWADLFAGDEAWRHAGLTTAQGLAWAAHTLPEDQLARRAALLDQAIAADPLHCGHWQERCAFAVQAKAEPQWWLTTAEAIVQTFARYPQVSWELLKGMPLANLPSATRVQIQRVWLKSCGTPVPDQITLLPTDRIVADMLEQRGKDSLKELFSDVFELTLNNPQLLPRFFQGCSHLADKSKDKTANEQLLAVVTDIADKLKKTRKRPKKNNLAADGDAVKALCVEGILTAEKVGDKRAYSAFSNLGARYVKKKYPHAHEPFPGELLSSDGILKLSTSSGEYDEPLAHAGVLNGKGGFFHTDPEARPSVTVELGHQGTLSGMVIVNCENNRERAVPFKVTVSMDGKTWIPVFRTPKLESIWRIDLASKRPTAKYVRIEGNYPDGRVDILHLSGIFVYGQRTE